MAMVKKLWSKKNSVIFVWPGEEALELKYDGTRIVVPPRDVIGRVGLGSPYTHPAAERGGRPVPGTAVIEDVTTITPEGGYKMILNIDHICRYLTRDRDELFARGFNIVETEDQIEEAMTLGVPLYDQSQVERARQILNREAARQKGYKDRGEIPPASTSEHLVAWAVNHLRTVGSAGRQAHSIEDIESALRGEPAPTPSAPAPKQMVHDAPVDRIAQAAAVFAEARSFGIGLGNFELQALLSGSEEAIAKVKVKIEAKRREKTVKDAEAAATVA